MNETGGKLLPSTTTEISKQSKIYLSQWIHEINRMKFLTFKLLYIFINSLFIMFVIYFLILLGFLIETYVEKDKIE